MKVTKSRECSLATRLGVHCVFDLLATVHANPEGDELRLSKLLNIGPRHAITIGRELVLLGTLVFE